MGRRMGIIKDKIMNQLHQYTPSTFARISEVHLQKVGTI